MRKINLLKDIKTYEILDSEHNPIKVINASREDLEQELCKRMEIIASIEEDGTLINDCFNNYICGKDNSENYSSIDNYTEDNLDETEIKLETSKYQIVDGTKVILINNLSLEDLQLNLCESIDLIETVNSKYKNISNLLDSVSFHGNLFLNFCKNKQDEYSDSNKSLKL